MARPVGAQALRAIPDLDVGRSLPGVNYIPLPKIGEGLGEWLKPLLMKKGLGLMEDCRGTLHKSRPSLGTLNLRAEESKDR